MNFSPFCKARGTSIGFRETAFAMAAPGPEMGLPPAADIRGFLSGSRHPCTIGFQPLQFGKFNAIFISSSPLYLQQHTLLEYQLLFLQLSGKQCFVFSSRARFSLPRPAEQHHHSRFAALLGDWKCNNQLTDRVNCVCLDVSLVGRKICVDQP